MTVTPQKSGLQHLAPSLASGGTAEAGKRRAAGQFFPTTGAAVDLLLLGEKTIFGRMKADDALTLREPCCGQGHISRQLEAAGHVVISTDIREDAGYGEVCDLRLLTHGTARLTAARLAVVTNLPFSNSVLLNTGEVDDDGKPIKKRGAPKEGASIDLLVHLIETCAADYAAILLPLNYFMKAEENRRRWRSHAPTRIIKLALRIDFTGQGQPMQPNHGWFIWDRAYQPDNGALTLLGENDLNGELFR